MYLRSSRKKLLNVPFWQYKGGGVLVKKNGGVLVKKWGHFTFGRGRFGSGGVLTCIRMK
jgi:hypothetical protein